MPRCPKIPSSVSTGVLPTLRRLGLQRKACQQAAMAPAAPAAAPAGDHPPTTALKDAGAPLPKSHLLWGSRDSQQHAEAAAGLHTGPSACQPP
ncbi:hypothetical protein CVIRNUC_000117 [Coccomyxa viridis]|uniref:Uncharacterized protein n=1 Tax=Coccomyxa viridis TaxID=1274662 RepID=A0AAV1HS44_9CHLO|nr:hypothetical protein CVIRNUC_000117 [Coccomyxa viridis]